MINLLPPIEKQRIRKEHTLRILIVYIIFVSTAIAIGLVLLLPSYFFVSVIKKGAESEILIIKNSSESTEREEIDNQLRITKERLLAVTEQEPRTPFYEVIEKMANYVDWSINIDTISYIRATDEGNSSLQLVGFAKTRDNLLSFTKSLENDDLFSEVILPVSSLAKDQDIEFNIIIKGIF